ncbi:lysoplasmalogenase isoform X3 [Echinops telfairi]|uniref:Lysoplasmalogenase isoform X3 n=1 Tax=Echinops telfairi TaxID=9371 RepID=A0AC55DAG6_ECHTE|nr:lysoplasmalogenase isoform X3 [Echinops telfairi]
MDTQGKRAGHTASLVKCLTPFLLTCPAYFLFWIPEDPPSLLGALVKCLPVLSLAAGLQALTPPGSTATLLKWGLLCSAVGDACLIWPDAFLHGMVAFAAAHLFYLVAFGFSPLRPGLLLPIALVSGLYLCFLLLHLPPDMTLPVAAYSLMLAAVLWRGLARGGSAGLGALLFTLSDAVLAWGTFVWPLPHARLMIMTTYYAAQALIALSVLEGPKHKAS